MFELQGISNITKMAPSFLPCKLHSHGARNSLEVLWLMHTALYCTSNLSWTCISCCDTASFWPTLQDGINPHLQMVHLRCTFMRKKVQVFSYHGMQQGCIPGALALPKGHGPLTCAKLSLFVCSDSHHTQQASIRAVSLQLMSLPKGQQPVTFVKA